MPWVTEPSFCYLTRKTWFVKICIFGSSDYRIDIDAFPFLIKQHKIRVALSQRLPCSLRAFALITHGVYGVQYFLTWIWQFLNRNLHATGVEIWKLVVFVVTLQRIRGYALRVKAAAQHSSSELGSAFALHFPCSVKSWRDNKETKRQVVRRLEGPGTWRIGDRHKN